MNKNNYGMTTATTQVIVDSDYTSIDIKATMEFLGTLLELGEIANEAFDNSRHSGKTKLPH